MAIQFNKEEAIQCHRDMWQWILEQATEDKNSNKELIGGYILYKKQQYVETHPEVLEKYGLDEVESNCFACAYGLQQQLKYEDLPDMCNTCPFVWVDEELHSTTHPNTCCSVFGKYREVLNACSAKDWDRLLVAIEKVLYIPVAPDTEYDD